MIKHFSTIELFAGAGGLSLGLEKAGFNNIGLIENDKNSIDTLKLNRPYWNVICEDISKISCLDLEKYFDIPKYSLDLLSGGAPCQSFSYAGKRLGLQDVRGTLFYHYAMFLEKLQPKMFIFENVKGLKTHDNGNTFTIIMSIFSNMGYDVQYKVLNAWDYNVAQKRERLIIIGIRQDLKNILKFEFPMPYSYKPVLKDIFIDVPNSNGIQYSDFKKEHFKLIPQGGNWKNLPDDIAKKYMKNSWYSEGGKTGYLRKLSLNEPSLTILTTPSQKQTERCHPLENRPLTIRETARCQSFPDEWEFSGNIMSQYKQIGNAVPVNMAYAIGLKIKECLNCLS